MHIALGCAAMMQRAVFVHLDNTHGPTDKALRACLTCAMLHDCAIQFKTSQAKLSDRIKPRALPILDAMADQKAAAMSDMQLLMLKS